MCYLLNVITLHLLCSFLHNTPTTSYQRVSAQTRHLHHNTINQQTANPVKFGADPTGHTNSVDAFNKCVAYAISNSINIIDIPGGTYVISQSGIDDSQRPYGVNISNAHGLSFRGVGGKVTIATDIAVEPTPINAFRIYNSSDITVSNITFRAAGNNRPNRGKLYTGAGVYTEGAKNISVVNCRFENTFYAVCAFRSAMLNVRSNIFINGNYDSYNCMPKSAILLFSTSDSKVINNTIYGSLVDGDLSLFGLHTDNCLISGNKLYGYPYNDPRKTIKRLAQGITIDQGPKGNTIQDNIVYGYFYGIDIKAATFNNIIKNNTVQFCKVGISERKGEALKANASLNNLVSNNTIIMGGDWNNNYKMYGIYQSVGIFSENRSDLNCVGNTIKVDNAAGQTGAFAGIAVKQAGNDNGNPAAKMEIRGNTVDFGNGSTGNVPVSSDAIYLSGMGKATDISKNVLSVNQSGARNLGIIKLDGTNVSIAVNDNKLPVAIDRSKIFKLNNSAKIGNFTMHNNTDRNGIIDQRVAMPSH